MGRAAHSARLAARIAVATLPRPSVARTTTGDFAPAPSTSSKRSSRESISPSVGYAWRQRSPALAYSTFWIAVWLSCTVKRTVAAAAPVPAGATVTVGGVLSISKLWLSRSPCSASVGALAVPSDAVTLIT